MQSFRKIGDVSEIRPSKNEARKKISGTDLVSFVPMDQLKVCNKDLGSGSDRILNDVYGGYTYFANEDVLLAKITPCFENGKLGIARNLTNGIGFGSSEFMVFRCGSEILQDYLFYFLSRECFRNSGAKVMTGAVGHKRVPPEFIQGLDIYLPSISEQKRIVVILDEAFAEIIKPSPIPKRT